jgi:hypothetical protein
MSASPANPKWRDLPVVEWRGLTGVDAGAKCAVLLLRGEASELLRFRISTICLAALAGAANDALAGQRTRTVFQSESSPGSAHSARLTPLEGHTVCPSINSRCAKGEA